MIRQPKSTLRSSLRDVGKSCARMISISAYSIAVLCGTALAGSGNGIPCGSAPGVVHEFSANPANFRVFITNPGGGDMNPQPPGFPVNVNGVPLAGGGFGANVAIPAFPNGCDVRNRTIPQRKKGHAPIAPSQLSGTGGEESDLRLESLFYNSASNTYSLQDLFGTIQHRLGNFAVVKVPDLYADTNGDGTLGSGGVLYSLVDMNAYLNNIPSFTEGGTFSIVNGTVAGLPGMLFSTTDFTFDPSTGFSGTDFTGDGVVESEHDLESVPEPGSLLLLGSGVLGLSGILRNRLRARR